MTLSDIRDLCRVKLQDTKKPYLWSNDFLNEKINEAEREACIRARLITDVSSNVTSIELTTTEKRYPLDPVVLDVIDCALESNPDSPIVGWTLTETELVFAEYPKSADNLLMTVVRLPIQGMSEDEDEPEIRSHHHALLVDWVMSEAYMVHDSDGFDPNAAITHLQIFERNFGYRPTANVQRKHREKHGRIVRMGAF